MIRLVQWAARFIPWQGDAGRPRGRAVKRIAWQWGVLLVGLVLAPPAHAEDLGIGTVVGAAVPEQEPAERAPVAVLEAAFDGEPEVVVLSDPDTAVMGSVAVVLLRPADVDDDMLEAMGLERAAFTDMVAAIGADGSVAAVLDEVGGVIGLIAVAGPDVPDLSLPFIITPMPGQPTPEEPALPSALVYDLILVVEELHGDDANDQW